MKLKINKKVIYTAIIILYIAIFALYIIRPMNFDTKMYLGAAYQADLIGSFPTNLFDAWEHKLILNRLIFYGIHKITCIFISPENVLGYEMIAKAVYAIFAVTLIGIFAKQTKNFFEKYKINPLIVFSSLFLIVFVGASFYTMQTEITGLLILLIPIMLVLKEKTIYNVLAGFFISLLFFLKGITISYAIIILAIMLIEKQNMKLIITTIVSSFAFLALEITGFWLFRPDEIMETFLSTQYLETHVKDIGPFLYVIANYFYSTQMVIGTIALIYNIICHIKTKNRKLLLIEITCYVLLIIGICIQRLKLFYQMELLMPAFLLSLYIAVYYLKNKTIKLNKYVIMAFLTILYGSTTMMVSLICERDVNIAFENNAKEVKMQVLYEDYPDIKDNEVLYIGNGLSAYYIKAKSYLKYTTTVYLAGENSVYKNNEYVKNIKDKIKEYQGKYIVLDDIELINKERISDDIIEFINKNYTLVENTGMNIHDDSYNEEYITIYVKNDKLGELKNNNVKIIE